MHTSLPLTSEEQYVAGRIEKYFKTANMAFKDKIMNAILIAQHELDAHHFSSESEKEKIVHFKTILDGLLVKINEA